MIIFPPSRYDTLPHDQLLRIAKSSAPEAEEAKISLLRAHEPLLKSKVKGIHSAIIEDAFQAAIIGFLKAIEKYNLDSGVPIGAYASKWVTKEVQKLLRREYQYYYYHLPLDDTEEGIDDIFGYDDLGFTQFEEIEEALEQRCLLIKFISTLTERELAIISLYYSRGYTQARIAQEYGVSTVAINKQIHRILREGRKFFAS